MSRSLVRVTPFLRYTVLRIMLFFGVLLVLALVGMRGLLLLAVSAVLSMALSLVVLRGPRADLSAKVDEKVRGRLDGHAPKVNDPDAEAEDAEDEARRRGE